MAKKRPAKNRGPEIGHHFNQRVDTSDLPVRPWIEYRPPATLLEQAARAREYHRAPSGSTIVEKDSPGAANSVDSLAGDR